MGSHQSGTEEQNHLPRSAGHASLVAAQDMVGLLGCKRTLVVHVQLFIHQYPQVLLGRHILILLLYSYACVLLLGND